MGEVVAVIGEKVVGPSCEAGADGVEVLVKDVRSDVGLSDVENSHRVEPVKLSEFINRQKLNSSAKKVLAAKNQHARVPYTFDSLTQHRLAHLRSKTIREVINCKFHFLCHRWFRQQCVRGRYIYVSAQYPRKQILSTISTGLIF